MITFNLQQYHLDKQNVESVWYGIITAMADVTAVMLEQDGATNGRYTLMNTSSLSEGLQQFEERAHGAVNNETRQLPERMGSAPDDVNRMKVEEKVIAQREVAGAIIAVVGESIWWTAPIVVKEVPNANKIGDNIAHESRDKVEVNDPEAGAAKAASDDDEPHNADENNDDAGSDNVSNDENNATVDNGTVSNDDESDTAGDHAVSNDDESNNTEAGDCTVSNDDESNTTEAGDCTASSVEQSTAVTADNDDVRNVNERNADPGDYVTVGDDDRSTDGSDVVSSIGEECAAEDNTVRGSEGITGNEAVRKNDEESIADDETVGNRADCIAGCDTVSSNANCTVECFTFGIDVDGGTAEDKTVSINERDGVSDNTGANGHSVNTTEVVEVANDAAEGVAVKMVDKYDFGSHTGALTLLGEGAIYPTSVRQKLNDQSSTVTELVDDSMAMILWARQFMEGQGYTITDNVVYQDNLSSMLLEQIHHFDFRYFFTTDRIPDEHLAVECYLTGNVFTRLLQGAAFVKFRRMIRIIDDGGPQTDLSLPLRSVLENKGFEEREANDGMPVTMTASGADGHGRGTAGCVAAERETAGCGNQRGAVNQRCVTVGSRLWKASMGVDG